jgi:hypothetical protein
MHAIVAKSFFMALVRREKCKKEETIKIGKYMNALSFRQL